MFAGHGLFDWWTQRCKHCWHRADDPECLAIKKAKGYQCCKCETFTYILSLDELFRVPR